RRIPSERHDAHVPKLDQLRNGSERAVARRPALVENAHILVELAAQPLEAMCLALPALGRLLRDPLERRVELADDGALVRLGRVQLQTVPAESDLLQTGLNHFERRHL